MVSSELVASSSPTAYPTHRKYSRLSDAEEIAAFRLRAAGKTQTEIAKALGCDQSSVSRCLQKYDDTRDAAKAILHNNAKRLAERVANAANVEESLEVLDRLDVLVKRQETVKGPSVVVLMPGQTQMQAPILDLSPVLDQHTTRELEAHDAKGSGNTKDS